MLAPADTTNDFLSKQQENNSWSELKEFLSNLKFYEMISLCSRPKLSKLEIIRILYNNIKLVTV